MKNRFTALDIRAVIGDLKPRLVGLRLANVYDINPKTYLWKFAAGGEKVVLLTESGIRVHSTIFAHNKSATPSGFSSKLRKHLRSRRLTDIRQLGYDRIVDMKFGDGEAAYHVLIELFASGNIILTDHTFRIIALLRVVTLEVPSGAQSTSTKKVEGETDAEKETFRMAVGEIYEVGFAREFAPMTDERLREILTLPTKPVDDPAAPALPAEERAEASQANMNPGKGKGGDDRKKDGKGGAQQKGKSAGKRAVKQREDVTPTLRKWLKEKAVADFSPVMIDSVLHDASVEATVRVDEVDTSDTSPQSIFSRLLHSFEGMNALLLTIGEKECEGWIVLKDETKPTESPAGDSLRFSAPAPDAAASARQGDGQAFEEFHPFAPSHLAHLPLRRFPTFSGAADEFFSLWEHSKLRTRAEQAETVARRRVEQARKEHEARIAGLTAAQEQSIKIAQAVERHLDEVERVLAVVRSYLAAGFDWRDLEREVEEGKRRGSPEAMMVEKLKLSEGLVTVKLPHPDAEDHESDDESFSETESEGDRDGSENEGQRSRAADRQSPSSVLVDLDVNLGGYANAKKYYDARRQALQKQEKTMAATTKALKASERKAAADIKAAQAARVTATSTRPQTYRKPNWFEQFHWFISSENYLIVGGKDASQNELLVKKHLKPGDVYVHADLHGAASVVIKNPYQFDPVKDEGLPPPPPGTNRETPIPPQTLLQAGTMAVCTSGAWDSKVITSAWWVHPDQVSKTAPTGEYLTAGSFMIRGKKNWLPPVQLVYGFALLFRVEEGNVLAHLWDRRPWGRGDSAEEYKAVATVSTNADDEASSIGGDANEDIDVVGQEQEVELDGGDDGGEENITAAEQPGEEQPSEPTLEVQEHEGAGSDSEGELNTAGGEEVVEAADAGDAVNEQGTAVEENETDRPSSGPNRRLTAKERRDLKKGKQNQASSIPEGGSADKGARSSKERQPSTQNVRGKRGKLKKMQEKYADQDDDEREIALKLLGAAKSEPPTKAPTENKPGRGVKSAPPQRSSGQPPRAPPEPAIAAFDDEDDGEAVPAVTSEVALIDQLTGTPSGTDDLIYAIPVCGPWNALQRYKYKVKLVPGAVKRGKAARSAVSQFQKDAQSESPQEKEIVRIVQEMDAINAMLPKVKMLMTQTDNKGGKKSKR
ncbi:DUF814-domain-containing protein [Gonapodya prolifera JEL478]|uniref:DUF814-domain-containing protein n=1 Tax=Gonapodya prolifera (strain JEL478) TaxID=1344416 RepID=A0A138ZXY6_GONPJ|nr:DUF814-domain-containing protein [Gonapodya prolifera JEL478]|eukprot:KXS09301.1 DUF814-domain-containing protein [Gonapodya prolifera JEL478]